MKRIKLYIFAIALMVSYTYASEHIDDVYVWNNKETTVFKQEKKKKNSTNSPKKNKSKIQFIEDNQQNEQHPDTIRAIIKR